MSEIYRPESFFNDTEYVRDFFELHQKEFANDRGRDAATFRHYLEEYRITEPEALDFLAAYKKGNEQMQVFLKDREVKFAATAKEEPPQEPKILPFKKPDSTAPDREDQKTAA